MFISNIIKKKINLGYILAVIGILVSPYLLMIFTGVDQLYRTQFNYSFIIGFIFLFCFLDLLYYKSKVCKFCCFILLVLSVGIGFRQSLISSSIYYSDQIRYENDLLIADKIQTEIEKQNWFKFDNISEFKIIFLGKTSSNHINIKVNEVMGASFFEFDYPNFYGINDRASAFMRILGYNYSFANEKDYEKAKEYTRQNDKNKFITKIDNIIIVRLSEEFI